MLTSITAMLHSPTHHRYVYKSNAVVKHFLAGVIDPQAREDYQPTRLG